MSSHEWRIIFHHIFFILSIFHLSYFACSTKGVDSGLNAIRQTSKTDANCLAIQMKILVFLFIVTVGGLCWPIPTYAASCDALIGKWAWFIGGEVMINSDGTFTQQSGNSGTWECLDASKRAVKLKWKKGGYVNSLVLSANGTKLSSTDPSQ